MARVPPQSLGLAGIAAALVLNALVILASAGAISPAQIALNASVGWLFMGAGALVWHRRPADRLGLLMIATGVAWFVGGVVHRGPLVHLLLAFPSGRLTTRLARCVVLFAYIDGIVGSFLVLNAATVVLAVGLLVAAGRGILSSSGAVRRGRVAAAIAGVALAVVLVAWPVASMLGIDLREAQQLGYEAVLALTVIGITADLMWGGWSRSALTGLVVELGTRAEAGTLRDRLARALGDPSLVVGYLLPDSGAYFDEAGRAIELPEANTWRVVTPVGPTGSSEAIIIHDPAVLGDPALLVGVAAAVRVAVANAQLQLDVQERVTELEASQRRIVEVGDVQRRQLEQELSAGSITRMGHVGELLQGVRSAVAGSANVEVAAAIAELALAEDELRRFAQGVFPRTLADRGLADAIAELAARSSIPIDVRMEVERHPATIEATAYFVCSEALANLAKHAHATRAEVRATDVSGQLVVVIADDGVGGADLAGSGLRGLQGRVGAMGGRLTLVSPRGRGTRLEAVLPGE
jgi:signal transduction histidine kinase